jgi:hypothetical protein
MMRLCTWWQKRHAKKTKRLHIITCLKSKFILNILLLFTLSLMWAITNAKKYFLWRKFFQITKIYGFERYLKWDPYYICQQNIHILKHYQKCILSTCCCLVMILNIAIT